MFGKVPNYAVSEGNSLKQHSLKTDDPSGCTKPSMTLFSSCIADMLIIPCLYAILQ